jgi:hypothetical protein
MVDNMIAFFYWRVLLQSACPPPDARQSVDKVSGDYSYSHQYEAVDESNSQDFEVPISTDQHGLGG